MWTVTLWIGCKTFCARRSSPSSWTRESDLTTFCSITALSCTGINIWLCSVSSKWASCQAHSSCAPITCNVSSHPHVQYLFCLLFLCPSTTGVTRVLGATVQNWKQANVFPTNDVSDLQPWKTNSEVDTRIFLHRAPAAGQSRHTVYFITVDSDIVVLAIYASSQHLGAVRACVAIIMCSKGCGLTKVYEARHRIFTSGKKSPDGEHPTLSSSCVWICKERYASYQLLLEASNLRSSRTPWFQGVQVTKQIRLKFGYHTGHHSNMPVKLAAFFYTAYVKLNCRCTVKVDMWKWWVLI